MLKQDAGIGKQAAPKEAGHLHLVPDTEADVQVARVFKVKRAALGVFGIRAHAHAAALGPEGCSTVLTEATGGWDGLTEVTVYEGGTTDTYTGEVQRGTWLEFGQWLVNYSQLVAPKGEGRWLTAGVTTNGRCRDIDIAGIGQLVFDCDEGGEWDRMREVLDRAGLAYVVQRSASHRPEKPKWHLHLPLNVPWVGDKKTWQAIYRHLIGWFAGAGALAWAPEAEKAIWSFDTTIDRLGQPIYPACRRLETDAVPLTVCVQGGAIDLGRLLDLTGFDLNLLEQPAPKTARARRLVQHAAGVSSSTPSSPSATSSTPTGSASVEQSLLGLAFDAAGMLGPAIGSGKCAVECPWEVDHTTGTTLNGSTLLFAPTSAANVGFFLCSHAHCKDKTQADVLQALPPAAVATARATLVQGGSWRDELLVTEKKDPATGALVEKTLPVLPNLVTILRNHPQWVGVIAWNSFAERVVTTTSPPWRPTATPEQPEDGGWVETDVARVVDWLGNEEGVHVGTKLAAEAVGVVAESRVVHPVRDYLARLKWDGLERLPTWLSDYCGTEHSAYTKAVGTRWMISGVARVMRPGCQVDCMLVLESREQGTGKSSAFRSLVPHPSLYSETGVTIGDKDSYQSLHGIWIYLLDELDSLKRSDVSKTKNFLSSMKDHYRPSYGRSARDFLRQNVFAGTTNETEYLIDRTGNRRIWPARVVRTIDVQAIARDRDQLWAEALHRFDAGEAWHVDTPELRGLCEAEQADRVHEDPWEQIVAAWLAAPGQEGASGRVPFPIPPGGVTTGEVLEHALNMRPDLITKTASMRMADVLRTLGYARGEQQREGEARVRRFR